MQIDTLDGKDASSQESSLRLVRSMLSAIRFDCRI